MKALMTAEDVSRDLCIAKNTLYKWTCKGIIPYIKVRGYLRFRPDVIDNIKKYGLQEQKPIFAVPSKHRSRAFPRSRKDRAWEQ